MKRQYLLVSGIALIFVILLVGTLILFSGTSLTNTSITNILKADTVKKTILYEKTYNESDNSVVIIRNSTGDKMVEMKLLTPLNLNVVPGINRTVFEIEVNPVEQNMRKFLSNMEFYYVENGILGDSAERTVHWQWREEIGQEWVDVKESVCYNETSNLGVEGIGCYMEVVGQERKPIYKWNDFDAGDFSVLPKEVFVVRGIADVGFNDKIEWIPSFFGEEDVEAVRVEEWATWTSTYNDDLRVYWAFDDESGTTATDSTPNGIDGTLENGANFITDDTSDRIKNGASSVEMDDTGDRVKGGYSGTIGIGGGNAVSMSLWVNLTDFGNGDYDQFFNLLETCYVLFGSKDSTGTNNEIWLSLDGTGSNVYSTGVVTAGQWQHVAFTYNGTIGKIYINGGEDGSGSLGSTACDNNDYWYVGGHESSANRALNGWMDEFAFWNRTLTPTEVSDLYNSGDGIFYTSSFDSSPIVELTNPLNNTNLTDSYSIYFGGNFTDDSQIDNSTLYLWYSNGTLYDTVYVNHDTNPVLRNNSYTFPSSVNENTFLWNFLVYDNSSTNAGVWNDTNRTINLNVTSTAIALSGSQVAPSDSYLTSSNTVYFTGTGTINYGSFNNATITVWDSLGSVYYTNTNTSINGLANTTVTVNWSSTFIEGTYSWNVQYCGSNSTTSECDSGDSNYSFEIDTSAPSISYVEISDQFVGTSSVNVTLNFTGTDVGGAGVDSCWFSNETGGNETITCGVEETLTYTSAGEKTVYMYINDTLNNVNYTTQTFDIGNYLQSVDKEIIGEGDVATFNLSLSQTDIGSKVVTAYLVYDGDSYTLLDSQTTTSNNVYIEKSIAIPDGSGNTTGVSVNWYWNFSITSVNYTTDTQTQTVYSVEIDDCTTYPVLIYNFTAYDEEDRTLLNSSVTTVGVDLTIKSITDSSVTWFYSDKNNTSNNILVCIPDGLLNSTDYSVDIVGQYESEDYVNEFWYADNDTLSLDDVPNNIGWYDLLLDDSTTVLMQYKDENGLAVEDAIIQVERRYVGDGGTSEEYVSIERSKQDENGQTQSHLVEEDEIYRFRIYLNGQEVYLSSDFNVRCLETPCSITISEQSGVLDFPTDFDNLPEGTYSITLNKTSRTVTLRFSLNESATMNLSVFRYSNNPNEGDEVVGTAQITATSGNPSVTIPITYDNSTYYASVFKDEEFVGSKFVSLQEDSQTYFPIIGAILGGIIVLVIGLMGISQGEFVILWALLGVITAGSLMLVNLSWLSIMGIVAVAVVLLIKLSQRRRVG